MPLEFNPKYQVAVYNEEEFLQAIKDYLEKDTGVSLAQIRIATNLNEYESDNNLKFGFGDKDLEVLYDNDYDFLNEPAYTSIELLNDMLFDSEFAIVSVEVGVTYDRESKENAFIIYVFADINATPKAAKC